MPDPTRETIAELRRLRKEEGRKMTRWQMCSNSQADDAYMALRRAEMDTMLCAWRHLDALLAAAERGLGAGDGR